MSQHRGSMRYRDRTLWNSFKHHFRSFTTFMFSNVGIILLVIVYTIGGAFIFQSIEIYEHEQLKFAKPHKFIKQNLTKDCLDNIWQITARNISFYHNTVFKSRLNDILLTYQRKIVVQHIEENDVEKQWSFSGAFLYSLTVITTIGYGNISPKSDWGKLVTILYAIIGMPLFLLYLSNIGDVLAKSFKWIYSKVCLCRICPGVARRRILRERRKLQKSMRRLYEAQNSNNGESNSSSLSSDSSTFQSTITSSLSLSKLELRDAENASEIDEEIRQDTDEITVPLTVCVLIMISYILAGAILFSRWEDWDYLDGSYFCFISLSSIGFGDLVPGDRVITADKDKVEMSFILCAVYLLLGMALIAMCFNLMQEQVIHNMRAMKRAFKVCFRCGKT